MRLPEEEHTIHLDGKPVRFLLKRGSGRRINIRISIGGDVKVSAPPSTPVRRIKDFLFQKENWILRHIQKGAASRPADPLDSVQFMGTSYQVELAEMKVPGNLQLFQEKKLIQLCLPRSDRAEALITLEKFLRKQAKNRLPGRMSELSRKTAIPFKRLSIRNQRTRWGSSSSLGNININWRIIMAPEKVIDYLLIHELVHQVHHNHSKDFYKAVESFIPEYRECNTWLKTNAQLLSLF